MNLIVPAGVRESLGEFELSGHERFTADEIAGCTFRDGIYGSEDNLLEIIGIDYRLLVKMGVRLSMNWPKFITERLVSEEELNFLVGDQSPFLSSFADGKGTPKMRYRLLMEGFFRGNFASRPVREIWQRQLELNSGDIFQAEINLEFELENIIREERLRVLSLPGKSKVKGLRRLGSLLRS